MRLLLLNNNPAVSRLIKLSVDKVGYELDEFEEYALVPLKSYDLIMVDNECYDEDELKTLCEHSGCNYTLYICQRGAQKPDFTNVSLEKPFLPTDFITLLDKVKNVIESTKPQEAASELVPSIENNEDAYDIDAIDTFGVDSASVDAMPSFEELSLEDNEALEKSELFDDDDKEELLDMPTFDLDTKEDDALDLAFIKGSDDASDDLALSEFNFDDLESSEEASSDDTSFEEPLKEEESAPCILDRDDINEVKQLLDESDEEESEALLAFDESSALDDEESLEEETFSPVEESSVAEDDEMSLEEIDEPLPSFSEAEDISEDIVGEETQEDIIDDFQEEIEEKIEEEQILPHVSVGLDTPLDTAMFSSLDDLNETAIKRAFGEEVDDEIITEESAQKPAEVEIIRGEIETSIAKSISSLAQSDILKEALKGMRINISITFDEKN